MTIRQTAFVALSFATALTFASSAFGEAKYASEPEFVAAAAGKTLATKTKAGKNFSITYDAKGGGIFTLGDHKPAKFTWSFKGGTLCSTFKTISFTECNKVQIVSPSALKFIDAKSGQLNNDYSVK